jgi:hypothetical protein
MKIGLPPFTEYCLGNQMKSLLGEVCSTLGCSERNVYKICQKTWIDHLEDVDADIDGRMVLTCIFVDLHCS